MGVELKKIDTEQRNPRTAQIDTLSTLEMVTLINEEDHKCAEAVRQVLPEIARSIDVIYEKIKNGGRLFYCGAGTSGRLGVLDAAECPPTYGVDPGLVVGLIAGGAPAFLKAVEGAEDSRDLGKNDLIENHFCDNDALVGIAASGRTPYVIGAMDYARSVGAPVMALVCCRDSEMSHHADITMAPIPGPEVVTGSSRMKSGTCQKLVLNLLSTCVMIKLGKVYGNLMVDVKASNEKLVHRAISIVCTVTGESEEKARETLEKCDFSCKTAIVMLLLDTDAVGAKKALDAAEGRVALAISQSGK
ncbi:MAG: N-acetylmuramic acid 6-phosphate etherase [Clostridia bacterium]|nr:N-acetylmuramic acid 6-phosphate etherase [Clostridia bacterium]